VCMLEVRSFGCLVRSFGRFDPQRSAFGARFQFRYAFLDVWCAVLEVWSAVLSLGTQFCLFGAHV